MTAEVLVMNKIGLALAADSAVTISGGPGESKTYNTANKVFALSKYEPVAVMIYGGAEIMGIPWEVVLKQFRTYLGRASYPTLEEYKDELFKYLCEELLPNEAYERYVRQRAFECFTVITKGADKNVEKALEVDGEIDEDAIKKIHQTEINALSNVLDSIKKNSKNKDDIKPTFTNYRPLVKSIIEPLIHSRPISGNTKRKLIDTCLLFAILFPGINKSGLVLAGYGSKDNFPAARAYEITKILDGKVEFDEVFNRNIELGNTASVRAFAQTNEVGTFMNGISQRFLDYCARDLKSLFSKDFGETLSNQLFNDGLVSEDNKEKVKDSLNVSGSGIVDQAIEQLQLISREDFSGPVINAVSFFSPTEMASMAETLVNLESFRKQVTLNMETVGGPIDVCVITKGDGLVWIKRKHYFDKELNHQFFSKYNLDFEGDQHD